MKFFAFCFLATSISYAADLTTGQAARLVIGQTTFTSQEQGASDTLVGGVGAVAYANDTLFVTDSNRLGAGPINHRALVYKDLSLMLPGPTDEIPYYDRCPVCGGVASLVLGQPDFTTTEYAFPPTQTGLRTPTAVATDGVRLVIADSDNNRVVIWNSIPTTNQQPPDVVLGQPNFTSNTVLRPPTASSLRGPQGVWIQDGRLFVADTFNNRVMIWNQIPTTNGAPADIVLGQTTFSDLPETDPAQAIQNVQATTLLSPVSVSSDGQRLYVADLGYDRVLIWNSIPTRNQQPADVVVGQPDLNTATPNNSSKLCESTGTDDAGNLLYPPRCAATINTPRFALSDGHRLFISDSGNDRVLIYDSVPASNGLAADKVLGQRNFEDNISGSSQESTFGISDATLFQSSADSMRSPLGLAWDGSNLYVADPFNRRILVFTLAEVSIPYAGVRNAASRTIHALGTVALSGAIKENDEITITIGENDYSYTLAKNDSMENVVTQLVNKINAGAGDPLVYASPNLTLWTVLLVAREEGEKGNEISLSVKWSENSLIVATASGGVLRGGQDAAKIAPGTLVQIKGESLAGETAAAPSDVDQLPSELGGVQVYMDGVRAPLLFVSPTQINAQLPFEMQDTTSVSTYVRVKWPDGRVTATNPVGVPVIPQNPGIFGYEGDEPRQAVALHYSSRATATFSIDGTAVPGDTVGMKIEERTYSYTVQEGDTLTSIRDALVAAINHDPKVEAFPSGIWTRVRLRARVPGQEGNGIRISSDTSESASAILSPFNEALCCANVAGSLVTADNPARPGETIVVYATGLGLVKPDRALEALVTGAKYEGPDLNEPQVFVSSLAGGKTANVLYTGMKRGSIGLYEVHLELNAAQPTDPLTQLTIAQDVYVSNIATIPVVNFDPSQL